MKLHRIIEVINPQNVNVGSKGSFVQGDNVICSFCGYVYNNEGDNKCFRCKKELKGDDDNK